MVDRGTASIEDAVEHGSGVGLSGHYGNFVC
jgi:hypothetical protein